ncbi:hypothetical protein HHI36_017470 [Cryptolaemus montrouzieri]|uniref:Uncharacterized protein n=1 Tax=Cryptolaemus montrouzieri TaxID=559131 RepID=A0ABD2NNS4_9CUCU
MNDWIILNPDKAVQFAKGAYYAASNMNIITSAFKNTGKLPINGNIFSDEDFSPSFVTDEPPQSLKATTGSAENSAKSYTNEEPPLDLLIPQAGSSILNEPQHASSTSNEADGVPSDTEIFRVRTSADPLISLEAVRQFPKTLPRKPIEKRRKVKTMIITENPERDRLLSENVMNILNKKTPKTEKLSLKHVKQILKGNLTNKESNKTKNNEKAKKKKTDTK